MQMNEEYIFADKIDITSLNVSKQLLRQDLKYIFKCALYMTVIKI